MNFTIPIFATLTFATAGTAFGQYFGSQQGDAQAASAVNYQTQKSYYIRGFLQARDAHIACMKQAQRPEDCDVHKAAQRYYWTKLENMGPEPVQQQQPAQRQRPTAEYPGQGIAGGGDVAVGVGRTLLNGPRRFNEDAFTITGRPPVDYQRAIGGYTDNLWRGPGNLPPGGFTPYSRAPQQAPRRMYR